ncbi:hypothetical protein AB0E69_05850 [Kribbella sp. NPDC026611]|uniref:hypothetical protein n=1 Tax=Kribbella sp. NPDC026611 TaxID=3154911 RepID=UPI0033ECF047
MGRSLKCHECGDAMYAGKEDYQPNDTLAVYVCHNGRCPSVQRGDPFREQVFAESHSASGR